MRDICLNGLDEECHPFRGSIKLPFDFSIIITPLRGSSIFDSTSDFRTQTNYSPHAINGRTQRMKCRRHDMIIKPRHNTKPKSRRDDIISPLRGSSIFDSTSDFRTPNNYSFHKIPSRAENKMFIISPDRASRGLFCFA